MSDPLTTHADRAGMTRRLIDRMSSDGRPIVTAVAAELEGCLEDPDVDCGSLACPLCRAKFQRAFVDAATPLVDDSPEARLLTVIPIDGIVPSSWLRGFDVASFARTHRRRIATLLEGVRFAGAVDISANWDENEFVDWSVHLHVLVFDRVPGPAEKRLRRAYPRDPSKGLYRPVKFTPLRPGNKDQLLGYIAKADYTRRSSFLAVPSGGRNPYRSSTSQRLSVDQEIALHVALSKFRVGDQLILGGLKRMRTSSPTIVSLKPT